MVSKSYCIQWRRNLMQRLNRTIYVRFLFCYLNLFLSLKKCGWHFLNSYLQFQLLHDIRHIDLGVCNFNYFSAYHYHAFVISRPSQAKVTVGKLTCLICYLTPLKGLGRSKPSSLHIHLILVSLCYLLLRNLETH